MASLDHKELLMEIGSKDSVATSKSVSSNNSNLSAHNFNLSLKHLVLVKGEEEDMKKWQ